MAGKIVYTPAGGPETTYTFVQGPSFDYEIGYVDGAMDVERTLDRTLNSYAGEVKRTITVPFEYTTLAQLEAIQAAAEAQVEVDYYEDSGDSAPLISGMIMEPWPMAQARPYFRNGIKTWSYSMTIEES